MLSTGDSMKSLSIITLALIIVFCPVFSKESKEEEPVKIGHIEKFYSAILQEERQLEVSLPYGFDSGMNNYPLVLILDGGSLFRYVKTSLDVLTPNFFPDMVVVGLPNTDRRRDLDMRVGFKTGADKFKYFLTTELLPYMKKKYRTNDFNILMGHSLAGLYAFHTIFDKNSPFKAVIASSPSLAGKEGRESVENSFKYLIPDQLTGKFVFYSSGGEESDELKSCLALLTSKFETLNLKNFKNESRVFEGEGHFPLKGFYQGLRSLFNNWGPPREWFFNGTLEELINHFNNLEEKFLMKISPPSDLIWSLRNRLKREKKIIKLIKATEYHVEQYPGNTERYIVLADLYLENGSKSKAIDILKTGLELNNDAENIKKKLKILIKK